MSTGILNYSIWPMLFYTAASAVIKAANCLTKPSLLLCLLPSVVRLVGTAMSVDEKKETLAYSDQERPQRLLSISGYDGRRNDVLYHQRKADKTRSDADATVVFFGGDVQDYPENMLAHRDNCRHVKWNLEVTASLLADAFPNSDIFVVKPSRMQLCTFSCYDNFVQSNLTGVPMHTTGQDAHKHLLDLVENAMEVVNEAHLNSEDSKAKSSRADSEVCRCHTREKCHSLILIGFSKGCVVLNQLVYEFHHQAGKTEVKELISRVKSIYWLDCGHAGGSNVWITHSNLLQSLADTGIHLHVHVTPYQIEDEQRPWIRREEKIFTEKLRKMKANITRQLHFKDESPSIEIHFKLLEEFHKST